MTQFPALPLFVREYRMDTLHLSTLQHGAYLLLLMQAWGSPQCRLPDCDEKLAAWAGLSLADWGSLRHLLEPFFTIRGGWWAQKRLTREWHFVCERQKAARSRGKLGGIASALKRQNKPDTVSQEHVHSKLRHGAAPTPTPTEDSSLRSESMSSSRCSDDYPRESQQKKPSPLEILKTVLSEETAQDVVAHRKAKRAPLTPRAAKLLVAAFRDHGVPELAAEAMIANGWQGFRPEWMQANPPRAGPHGRSDGTRGFLRAVQADIERDRVDGQSDERGREESASKAVPLLDAPRRRE